MTIFTERMAYHEMLLWVDWLRSKAYNITGYYIGGKRRSKKSRWIDLNLCTSWISEIHVPSHGKFSWFSHHFLLVMGAKQDTLIGVIFSKIFNPLPKLFLVIFLQLDASEFLNGVRFSLFCQFQVSKSGDISTIVVISGWIYQILHWAMLGIRIRIMRPIQA